MKTSNRARACKLKLSSVLNIDRVSSSSFSYKEMSFSSSQDIIMENPSRLNMSYRSGISSKPMLLLSKRNQHSCYGKEKKKEL